ncbi:hypothetical protein EYC80_003426 [Monilinia laxa]|uniref:BTB domain-containing protein n=1 Tax=Monilinia laxa TaxID=61186 RepID=A0A5N6KE13_MONLA|nr:hypothetical protein EYC80_003426 [Monilinia laxa]
MAETKHQCRATASPAAKRMKVVMEEQQVEAEEGAQLKMEEELTEMGEETQSEIDKGQKAAAAEAKNQRDICEQKRIEAVSLKRSRQETPEFREIVGLEMVDIYVGQTKEHFRIHRGILCDKVPYFQKMFASELTEGFELKAHFPGDDPKLFDLFAGWVYFGTLRALTSEKGSARRSWDPVGLYSLADKFCLPKLMDQIIDTHINLCRDKNLMPNLSEVKTAYKLTPIGSPFRKFACASMHYLCSVCRQDRSSVLWPTGDLAIAMASHRDFAIDFLSMVRTQAVGVAPQDPRQLPKCEFHCHKRDELCPQEA